MTDQDLTPRIRFNEFHEPWNHLSLGRLGAIKMCKRILKCQTSETGDIPFYKIGTFGKTPDAFISKETFEEYKKLYSFPKVGDILISAAGTIGRTVRFSGEDSYYQDSNIVWIDNDETTVINPFLEILYSVVNWNTDTTTIQRLYNDNLRQTIIFSPKSLIEQNKVGSIFHHIIEILTAREKELEKLENVKKACMERMFPREGETTPRLRFNGFSDEWKETSFSDIYTFAREGGTPSTNNSDYYKNGTIPFVKIEDTIAKHITKTNSYITELGIDNSSAWIIPANNIVFTNGATIGNVAINRIPVATKQGILGIVYDKSRFDLEFLFYLLSSDLFISKVNEKVTIGTFATVILGNLNTINFLTPTPDEQKKIGEYFRHLDELIAAKRQEIEKLHNIKQALLDKMFV